MLNPTEKEVLAEALEDPDALLRRYRDAQRMVEELIELDMIVEIGYREPYLWVDTPPPEKDEKLGIGKHCAWQKPLHREAVKVAMSS